MKAIATAGVAALMLLSPAAFAQSPPISDAAYVMKASVGNMFEMDEAKLALARATDTRLKAFAQKMIDDHGKAEQQLQDAAGKSNLKPATALDKPHQAMLDNLKTFSGTDFDKIYIADQIAAHAETVDLLADYKQNGKNGDLQSWTGDTLPVVKGHLADIDAM